jgi:hypothetical protein
MVTKTKNPWLVHLAATRKLNPKITDFKKMASLAKSTYKVKLK